MTFADLRRRFPRRAASTSSFETTGTAPWESASTPTARASCGSATRPPRRRRRRSIRRRPSSRRSRARTTICSARRVSGASWLRICFGSASDLLRIALGDGLSGARSHRPVHTAPFTGHSADPWRRPDGYPTMDDAEAVITGPDGRGGERDEERRSYAAELRSWGSGGAGYAGGFAGAAEGASAAAAAAAAAVAAGHGGSAERGPGGMNIWEVRRRTRFLTGPSDPVRSLPIPSDPFRSLPIPSDPF